MSLTGSKGKAKTDGESEDDVPFMAQEERRPLHRARKTMQLHDVDSNLRDMRCVNPSNAEKTTRSCMLSLWMPFLSTAPLAATEVMHSIMKKLPINGMLFQV